MHTFQKIILLFFVALGFFEPAYSQANSSAVDIKSPNVASMDKDGEIRVSHFTGTPDISIPIVSLKAKHLVYDLKLNYNANLVKPNYRNGWTGLGWNLNLSYISRKVRGKIDEMDSDQQVSGYYKNGALTNPGWNWEESGTGNHIPNQGDRIAFHLLLRNTDTEPDLFSFNIMGMHGSFFLDENRNWKIQSDDFVHIALEEGNELITPGINVGFSLPNNVSKCFNKFILTDVHGNKYILGGQGAIEYSADLIGTQTASTVTANSWYLTEIIPANSEESIIFQYERGPYISGLFINAHSDNTILGDTNVSFNFSNWKVLGSVISPVYLKKILLNDQEISFDLSRSNELNYKLSDYNDLMNGIPANFNEINGLIIGTHSQMPFYQHCNCNISDYYSALIWMKLEKITYKVRDQLYRTAEFRYRDTSDQRLTLNELTISEHSGALKNYKFNYNNVKSLPGYLTVISDHWGFNNGASVSLTNFDNIYSAREADTSRLQVGLLTSIIYPTKGRVEFMFEHGTYSKIVDIDNRKSMLNEAGIGGLRIAAISSYSGDSILLEKRVFTYTIGNTSASSGILNSKPVYSIYNAKAYDFGGNLFSMSSVMSNSVNDLTDQMGVSIGYTEVKETQVKGSTGYSTLFRFTNHDNGYMDNNATYKYKADHLINKRFNSRAFERGRILEIISFDENGDTVHMKKNEWDVQFNETSGSRAMMFNYLDVGPASYNYYPSSMSYRDYYYPVLLKSATEKNYKNNVAIVENKTNYEYDPLYRNLRKTLSYQSNGDSTENTVSFINDYVAKTGFLSSVLYVMHQKGLFSYPLETLKKVNGKVVIGQIIEYRQQGSFVLPYKVYRTDLSMPGSSFQALDLAGNGAFLRDPSYFIQEEVLAFDNLGNAIELKQQERPVQSLLWGNYGYYPIAKIENATNMEVKSVLGVNFDFNNFNTGYQPYINYERTIDSVRKSLLKAQVYGYDFEPYIGVSKIVDPRGEQESYTYDGFGRLKTIFDTESFITKTFDYYYANQYLDKPVVQYYNKGDSISLQRNNCSPNRAGSFVTYVVPSQKYSSSVSQAVADSLERADIIANAQAYANQNGTCKPVLVTQCVQKNLIFPSGQHIEDNLYVTYTPCGAANEVTVPINNLSFILQVDEMIRVEVCSSLSGFIAFRYGIDGPILTIPEISVSDAGDCN